MDPLKHGIKAFTILESMMTMLIIMVVFGLTTFVFVSVSTNGFTPQKKKAYSAIQELRNETLKNQRYLDETFETDYFILQKTIENYNDHQHLKTLHITASFQNKTLCESEDLILMHTP